MAFFLVFACGLVIGGAAVGLFSWAYSTVVRESALSPLADLQIKQDPLTRSEVDSYVHLLGEQYRNQEVGCMFVGLVVEDDVRYFAFGTLPNGSAPDPHTIFELASVGKTFTGLVLADLIERGDVSPTASVQSLVPTEVEIPQVNGKLITLVDLVTQSSGLPSLPDNMPMSDPLNPYVDYTVPQMYDGLRAIQLQFTPGQGYAYSNLGFGLLGHILARKTGTEYESLVVERVCDVLQMNDTRITLSPEQLERVATPHDRGKPVVVWEDLTMAGAGSFLSTAEDMLKYLRAHWGDENAAISKAMKRAVRKIRRTETPSTAIGFGWHIVSENALDIVWHNGGSGGSRSYAAMLPDRRLGVVVLANWSEANVDDFGRQLIYLLNLQDPSLPQATDGSAAPNSGTQ